MYSLIRNKKTLLLIVLIICCILLKKEHIVGASSSDNVSGFAWNDNFGWISTNSIDCDTNSNDYIDTDAITPGCAGNDNASTPVVNYGVSLNASTKDLEGYAYNAGVGWIYFGPDADLAGYGETSSSSAPSSPKTWAHVDSDTGKVTGWAKILSMGDNGWIKMSDDSVSDWNGLGVVVDPITGVLSGWAWNYNEYDSGMGWTSFNCLNTSTCASASYKVMIDASVPAQPTLDTAQDVSGTCKTVNVTWADNSSSPQEIGFLVQYASSSKEWITFCSVDPDVTSCNHIIEPNDTYYFRVKALGGMDDSAWSPDSDGYVHETSYCAPEAMLIDHDCGSIMIGWTQNGTGVDHYDVYSSNTKNGTYTLATTTLPTIFEYTETIIDPTKLYFFKVTADNDGLESSIIGPVNPCFNTGECVYD